jgi:hypothetical protein
MNTTNLEMCQIIRKTGRELFYGADTVSSVALIDFWRWTYSDLLGNTNRGRLAEFIVGRAVGLTLTDVRREWDEVDLITPTGLKIEVKSAAYLQSWYQKKLSDICFVVCPRRGWNAATNEVDLTARRHADVYVFAVLAHEDKTSVDPLNLSQWTFYVVPTSSLDSRKRSQYSITLRSLAALSKPFTFGQLRNAVEEAGSRRQESVALAV